MIRVESITITEFRGIRNLTLDFNGKNFAVCGPNGTGKSGVVDALEFALTGNVSRLAGEGRGGVSLKDHGPHVDCRDAPSKARVLVSVSIPHLGKTCSIERTVKVPGAAVITPDEPAIREVLTSLEKHPEIVLSRRELIKYVLATPGSRAKEVQALLQLDQVEKVRVGLQKAANAFDKEAGTRTSVLTQESENLQLALGVARLDQTTVLAAANGRRADLGLQPLSELTATTSLKDGMAGIASVESQRIPKAEANLEIEAARKVLSTLSGNVTTTLAEDVCEVLHALSSDPVVVMGLDRESFYISGVSLIHDDACPLCDNEWDPKRLKDHVEAKLKALEGVSIRRATAQRQLAPIVALMRSAQVAFNAVIRLAELADPPLPVEAGREFVTLCEAREHTLSNMTPLAGAIAYLAAVNVIPAGVRELLDGFEKIVIALPERTKRDAAREWLTLAQERLERYRNAQRALQVVQQHAETARKVSDAYQVTSDRILAKIYADVQNDFSAMYAFVNRTDEDQFKAELTPSLGKLGFDVEFYGRGFFPPGAYHSEGHQDGMGLCLYLALMRHIHGSGFTFAVLDDVLMSVDSGHRREVCALLKKDFPHTQFIMTTHDPIWLKHMQTEDLVDARGTVRFGRWSVESGPAGFREGDVWTEIGHALDMNDVRGAAALLRHHLEYESAELCHRLRAGVEFRGDHQYQLGELLPSAIGQLKKLYGEAKNAANSWNNKVLVEEIGARSSGFTALVEASKAEQWQVNAAVHYNSWATLETNDFEPVAKAYRELLDAFRCSQCREFLRVSPPRESKESLRCGCGRTQFNLLSKRK